MEIGIGLPAAVPDVDGKSLVDFARRAEAKGFSSLGTLDRLVYPNYEPLIALAAAAAVTERIRLTPAVLITPYRSNAALLAKQVATIHHLSGGRFVLGVGLGGREDDYTASGLSLKGRGKVLDRQLAEMHEIWDGAPRGFAGPIGPPVNGGPPILVGGGADAAYERAAKYADGWIMGGGPPEHFAAAVDKLTAAWERTGRDDTPRKAAITYFSLGPNATAQVEAATKHYYAWLGEYADMIAAHVATTPEELQERVQGFEQAGCDELIVFPASKDTEQVDLLAEAVLPVSAR